MKYWVLVWAGLWRRPVRAVLTVLSIVVAFLLFGIMQGVSSAFAAVQDRLRADRLLTNNVSLLPLPYAYLERIEQIPGVRKAGYAAMLVGNYKTRENTVIPLATDVRRLFEIFPEWTVSRAALHAMSINRTGAIVGVALARRFGWRVGDRVPLISSTLQRDGSGTWIFQIVGLYDSTTTPGEAAGFLVNYSYFDEARLQDRGTVVQYLTLVEHPSEAAIVAATIDNLFENSPSPTKTQSEKASVQSLLTQVGNVEFFVRIVLAAVFFALLLLTANTMAQSVRERVPEFATLKTIGLPDRLIVNLVLAESAAIFLLGAAVGLFGAHFAIAQVRIPVLTPKVSAPVLFTGGGLCVLVAMLSTIVPAWRARRLRIVDALRRA